MATRKLTVELSDGNLWWLYRDRIAEVSVEGHHRDPYAVVRLDDSTLLQVSKEQPLPQLMDFWREGIYTG